MFSGMRSVCVGAAAALMIGVGVQSARAGSVEPDNFDSGENISNAVSGVTLSAFGSVVKGTSDNVLAETADQPITSPGNIASTGTKVFGSVGPFADANFFDSTRTFRADFDNSVNTVSLDFISNGPESIRNNADNSSGTLTAFDSGGNQLDQDIAATITGGTFQTLTVNASSDIAYITASSPANNAAQATIGLDHLVFNANGGGTPAVPTPSAIGAGLVLLGGLAARRRRRPVA